MYGILHIESVNFVEIAEITLHINTLTGVTCHGIPYIQYEYCFMVLFL